jgi:hypothetical protein
MNRAVAVLGATVVSAACAFIPVAPSGAAQAHARTFANCTAMHRVYPHGVGRLHAHDHVTSGTPVTNFKRSNSLYDANQKSDRDGDHVACEAH